MHRTQFTHPSAPRRGRVRLSRGRRLLLACAAALLPGSPLHAADVSARATIGAGGTVRWGEVIAVRVELTNAGPSVPVELEILQSPHSSATSVQGRLRIESLPAGSRHAYWVYGMARPHWPPEVRVRIRAGKAPPETISPVQDPENPGTYSILEVGPRSSRLVADAAGSYKTLQPRDPSYGRGTAMAAASHTPPAGVPDRWYGLSTVDLLVLSDVAETDLEPDQVAAIRQYVVAGGSLLFLGGSDHRRLSSPSFEKLLPVRITGAASSGAGVRSSGTSASWPNVTLPSNTLLVRGEPRPGSTTLLSAGELPLAVESSYGQGKVYFVAFGPGAVAGDFMKRLVARALMRNPSRATGLSLDEQNTVLASLASGPLSIRLLDAPSFYMVAAFLLLYLIVLVPVNYGVLAKLNRRELGWITIPALVFLFTLGAYGLGYLSRGGRLAVASTSTLSARAGEDEGLLLGAAGVFSARSASYSLSPGPDIAPAGLLLPHLDAYAGYSPDASPIPVPVTGETQGLDDVRIAMWSMERVVAASVVSMAGGVTIEGKAPAIKITNGSRHTIRDAVYFDDEGAGYSLGRIEPGGSAAPKAGGPLISRDRLLLLAGAAGSDRQRMTGAGYSGAWAPTPTRLLAGWIDSAAPIVDVDGAQTRQENLVLLLVSRE